MPGPRMVEKRRSDRIAMALPVQVKGTDLNGADFEEFTRTVEIGLNGAKFSLKRLLAANQKIEIHNVRHGGQGPFRVVGQVSSPDSPGIFWGAECVGLSPSFWGIYFPPVQEAREAAARMILLCTECRNQAVSYLSDLETEVFDLTQRIVRFCDPCQRWSEWQRPPGETEETVSPAAATAAGSDLRKHRRLPVQMTACLQSRESEEEVVKTINISTGGLAVLSKKGYPKGSLLKIAFPYHKEGSNIFVLAQVARVSETDEPDLQYYGIEYVH